MFFQRGEGSPPKGDSGSPIEDKFEREADLTPSEVKCTKSGEELRDYRRNCLRDCKPKMHRELRRAGEHLDRNGPRAGAYAEDPKARGEFPPQTWHWAIRVELLDSERDWAWIAQHRNGSRVHAGTDRKSVLWAWAGVINSHMRTPALRRLREDAGESPPECGQEIFVRAKGLTRRNLYIESGTVFPKREGKPP